ncbi:MAG: FecR domain-containing protein [Bacteroidota bacterium]
MKNDIQLKELYDKYKAGTASKEERLLLENWYNSVGAGKSEPISEEKLMAVKEKMWIGMQSDIDPVIIRPSRKLWYRLTAAAVALIIASIGIWFLINSETGTVKESVYAQEVLPGKQRATLTLANGKKIRLTDAVNGELAKEAGVVITKAENGQLVYELKESAGAANKMNTLSTANGETYQLRLPDGSLVILNAASSLTYAANLNEGGKRRVKLTGEGYFQVAKDKVHPFVVESKGQLVEVLGTHFNINSYSDEPGVATTLVEGSVKVTAGEKSVVIKPGEQALNKGAAISVNPVNIDNVTDWKEGDFYLNRVPFKEAMRKIARWYDVQVVFGEDVPADIESGGWLSRDTKLSVVLKAIEKSGQVHFKVEKGKIYVFK